MFGAFSKLFKKSEPASTPALPADLQLQSRCHAPLPKDGTAAKASVPKALSARPAGADGLTIPYSAIIKLIPQELWGKLASAGVAGYNYTIARASVLEQLPHGSVKVSFGELRRGAPAGVFINTPAEDSRLVDLPLSEILAQLHPDTFARRPDQARIQVSDEVPDLFGAKGERLAPLRVMEKKEVSNTTSFARQNVAAPSAPKAATTFMAPPSNITPLPTSAAAHAALAAGNSVSTQQAAQLIKMPAMPLSTTAPAAAAAAARPVASVPFSIPKPQTPPSSQAVRPLPKAAPLSKPAAPAIPMLTPPGTFGAASFFIALDALAENWPDGVRQELAQLKIPDAKVALPPVEICDSLKRGRIQYPWRTLRSWIQPTPIYATPSPHDDVMLELPLRTLTPLFLDFIRANPVNRQAADAENITEFFRKAEQASGTSPDLLQPLFAAPPETRELSVVAALPVVVPVAAPVASAPIVPAAQVAAIPPTSVAVAPSQSSEAIIENGLLCLPIVLAASSWPEPVLHDIAQFGLTGARVEIPLANVELGLKVGRIEFAWREYCLWLNPPSKAAQVSINGETLLPLPLGLIAPLFLKNRGAELARKRTTVSDNIPDLFSALGKPLPPAPTSAEPVTAAPGAPVVAPTSPLQASAPVAPAFPASTAPAQTPAACVSVAALTPKKVPTNLSELFGEPNKKTWTPNEIVQRTTQLPNVAGALIALQDGLLVASNMPSELKTETIAAFVPQIFGRLNQYSKELQMGDTKAVSFTVESGTVQVYNAGIIYFAAFGKTGMLLPIIELQLIAGELSRHTK
jgi:predicted regulator of Ras-like GTPase activity (Roadblock/LC7/MglB family)